MQFMRLNDLLYVQLMRGCCVLRAQVLQMRLCNGAQLGYGRCIVFSESFSSLQRAIRVPIATWWGLTVLFLLYVE